MTPRETLYHLFVDLFDEEGIRRFLVFTREDDRLADEAAGLLLQNRSTMRCSTV